MKRNFLITTAAAALLAGTMFAAAQGQGQIQGQGGASQGGVRIQGQGEAQGQTDKSQDKGKAQRSQKKEAQPQTQGQGGRTEGQAQQGGAQQQPQQGQRDDGKAAPKQGQRDDGKAPKQGQTQTEGGSDGKKAAQQKSGGGGGSVTLSTEQRTKIRTTVLQSKSAPRVTNVNFSIRVGTVVPRDRVKWVAVSPILVEIHPEWRGYVYFIVDDQIIIVEPRSGKIVAVLEV